MKFFQESDLDEIQIVDEYQRSSATVDVQQAADSCADPDSWQQQQQIGSSATRWQPGDTDTQLWQHGSAKSQLSNVCHEF